ncbi:uncharacterized protein LOC130291692 isoform X3 [Hyla sarda]|nr:uncharacterized protein LOC130291692 isoform X3 [Hyla sarda]
MVKFSQITIPRTWYALERKKNNTGRWRCEVKEFPDLWAEYDLEPSIPTSPAEKEKDTEETSVPASTMSTRILLTILTAVLLLIICIIVICVTLGFCIMRRSRRPSSRHQHHKDSNRSDNFPLTENISSDLSNPKSDTDTEVSYVELEIIRDPLRKPSRNYDTIYANIM